MLQSYKIPYNLASSGPSISGLPKSKKIVLMIKKYPFGYGVRTDVVINLRWKKVQI